MLIAFWNGRGIIAPGRQECINDTILPLNPVYVGFQEPKKESFSNTLRKSWVIETLLGTYYLMWVQLVVF
jgi:hypothetical protein